MKRSRSESIEFWRNHIIQAKSHPESIVRYCKANNLLESSFYYWRDKIFKEKVLKVKTKPKKVTSPFLPVVVSTTEFKTQSDEQQLNRQQLPDSKWVAAIITNVIRGLT